MIATNKDKINIVMPTIVWPAGAHVPLAVTIKSPKSHRRAVWKIAQFFRREFHYDFIQYAYEGEDPDHVAYLWVPDCKFNGRRTHCIGATCFRKRETDGFMTMDWIWIHPFWRRRGLLTAAWPYFMTEHGVFHVEKPWSDAMARFIEKESCPRL